MKKIVLFIVLILITGCTEGKKVNEIMNDKKINEIIIDGKKYDVTLENNDTVDELKKLFPLKIKMNDLNNNEKYAYLDESLPTKEYFPKKIKKGDIMLYGDTCIVIFYKNFETEYDYTKIGHINNLEDLNEKSIKVEIK